MPYFNQRDSRWANLKIGKTNLTMAQFGCVVTSVANMLTDFLDREVRPDEILGYLNTHNGFTADGLLIWQKVCEFTGGRLKYNPQSVDPKWTHYYIRFFPWGKVVHYVLAFKLGGNYIDPWDGQWKSQQVFGKDNQWLGYRCLAGLPVEQTVFPVDTRYGLPRPWNKYLEEVGVARGISPAGRYIRSKIKRLPTNREINGIVYGKWDFGSVFLSQSGTDWLNSIKQF